MVLNKKVRDCISGILTNRFEAPLKVFESEVEEFQSVQDLKRENLARITSAFDDL